MSISYKLNKDEKGRDLPIIQKTRGANSAPLWIPIDEYNKDYQEYLEWIKAGNTPEDAD